LSREPGPDPLATALSMPWGAPSTTIPVLRIFSVDAARQFYVDFLGFTVDFGGPAAGPGTPFYGQVTRQATSLHLAEQPYGPCPGSTVLIWMSGIDALWEDLNGRREHVLVWSPAVWVPEVEPAPWNARTLTLPDPFGNHLRFNEPNDESVRAVLPDWSKG
jgi:catechol 2,3-dioxygenase-like lactoylglutathione lyase family enzyme